jgi:hypothetical protein
LGYGLFFQSVRGIHNRPLIHHDLPHTEWSGLAVALYIYVAGGGGGWGGAGSNFGPAIDLPSSECLDSVLKQVTNAHSSSCLNQRYLTT